MGGALAKLLVDLDLADAAIREAMRECAAHACRRVRARGAAMSIEPRDAAVAYLWSWLENQVLAASRRCRSARSRARRCCSRWVRQSPRCRAAQRWTTTTSRSFAPGLALASRGTNAIHETLRS
jgi:urease accessory protein